jgi:rfaE bifunctional protein nucleotidyltransferase chain/domain
MIKIKNKIEIKKIISQLKKDKKKISLCHGCFDLLHPGHLYHLEESKNKADILIVSVTSDEFVNKGSGRPYFRLKERIKALSSLNFVDYVIESKTESAIQNINLVKPDFYCKGPDYKNVKSDLSGKIIKEISLVRKNKGDIYITSAKTFSSSKLINNSFNFTDEQIKFIKKINKKYSFKQLIDVIKKLKELDITIIGEAIIDIYQNCDPLGKSGKEPILIFSKKNTQIFLGGSLAIANNTASFVKKVNLISYLGNKQQHSKRIKINLKKNVNFQYVKKSNSPTIEKQRFIETYSNKKILGIYNLNDTFLNKKEENKIIDLFTKISRQDILILIDYGHGLFTNNIIKRAQNKKIFKVVNSQLNSSSIGAHTVNNFKIHDLIIFNEAEIRYEMRDKISSLELLIKKISVRFKTVYITVTRGSEGSILFNKIKNKFYYCPGFARNIVDKVGAGDSMIPLLSLILKVFKDEDLALFLSSLAAAEIVSVRGNEKSIENKEFLKNLEYTIKV